MSGAKVFYACGTDWAYEIGHTATRLYLNRDDLPKCTHECGVVRLEVKAEWLEDGTIGNKPTTPKEDV